MPPTKRETDTTELLEFLLNEVEADELTGLWALSYELSKKEHLDKTDTINLINKINDNLKNLKNLSAESLENTNDNIEQDQIEENIDNETVDSLLEILKEKNPLFKIEESLRPDTVKNVPPNPRKIEILLAENQSRPMSAPAFVTTTSIFDKKKENQSRPTSAPVTATTTAYAISQNQPNNLQTMNTANKDQQKPSIRSAWNAPIRSAWNAPIPSAWNENSSRTVKAHAGYIKKSRRKKRKRTKRKRKRTKRKQSKHKRTKRKRTKRNRKKPLIPCNHLTHSRGEQ